MHTDTVVIGAAGIGRRCLDIIGKMNTAGTGLFSVLGVVDDSPSEENLTKLRQREIPFLGGIDALLAMSAPLQVVLGIGYPATRRAVLKRIIRRGFAFPALVDPDSRLGTCVTIGQGVVIGAGVLISTHSAIGDFSQVNPGAVIGHDVTLAENVTINPAATVSGDVLIGEGCLIGAGSVTLQQLQIGAHGIVGAGAVVTKSVAAGATVKGIPAK